MICPNCGCHDHVRRTVQRDGKVYRLRSCTYCGRQVKTQEEVVKEVEAGDGNIAAPPPEKKKRRATGGRTAGQKSRRKDGNDGLAVNTAAVGTPTESEQRSLV